MLNVAQRLAIKLAERGEAVALEKEPASKRILLDADGLVPPPVESQKIRLQPVYAAPYEPTISAPLRIDIYRPLRELESVGNDLPAPEVSWDDLCEIKLNAEIFDPLPPQQEHVFRLIIRNCMNCFMGFESGLFDWNAENMRFEVPPSIASTRTGDFAKYVAANGSHVRRALAVCSDLRLSASQLMVSLASGIEAEIATLRRDAHRLQLHQCTTLISFLQKSRPLSDEIEMLTVLLGCRNLNKPGKLRRIPSGVELLNRAFLKAQSLRTPVLERLVNACTQPWLVQVCFAVGLTLPQLRREFSNEMRSAYFPDLFIEFVETREGKRTARVAESEVPVFIPPNIAEGIVRCYSNLVYIAKQQDPSAIKQLNSLDDGYRELYLDSLSNTSKLCLNNLRSIDVKTLINWHPKAQLRNQPLPDNQQPQQNVRIYELAKLLSPILLRAHSLDKTATKLFMNEITDFIKMLTDVLLLQDGRLWSLMCDVIDRSSEDTEAAQVAVQLTDIITSFYGPHFGVRPRSPQGKLLEISFEQNACTTLMFGTAVVDSATQISTQIMEYQRTRQFSELGLLGMDVSSVCSDIKRVAQRQAPLSELVSSVEQISALARSCFFFF